jgi:predicted SprT family Zn-dependent metalloprotease
MKDAMKEYKTLGSAFQYFNQTLFGNELPSCIITLRHQRMGTLGYYHEGRFQVRGKKQAIDEIALNPDRFLDRSDTDILSTLAHEMTHLWQVANGDAPRRGYHDKQWGAKMKEIGLYPSDTGAPGGKETGQHMSHYIIKGAKFDQCCKEFLKEARIELGALPVSEKKKKVSKLKYTCGNCGQNAWAKPGAALVCGNCKSEMASSE